MKTNLKDKFNNSLNIVRPLYKKESLRKRVYKKKFLAVHVGSTTSLVGDGAKITKVNKDCAVRVNLPGLCVDSNENNNFNDLNNTMLGTMVSKSLGGGSANAGGIEVVDTNQADIGLQVNNVCLVEHKHRNPEEWLRVFPSSPLLSEGAYSFFIRLLFCQTGLLTFLVLWTGLWVYVLFTAEVHYEESLSKEFQEQQNHIIIKLATELRQVTPVSPKWRQTIERRIENERRLTEEAVANGARHDSGRYWTLPGTFLFTVYVMTALGFGAPVPHSLFGKISALTYAVVAIPVHVILMLNFSTFIIASMDAWRQNKTPGNFDNASPGTGIRRRMHSGNDHLNDENSPELKPKSRFHIVRNKLSRCLDCLCVGYGLPFVFALYYILAVVSFGVLRQADWLHSALFPIQFTTTGGLAYITGYVRVLYGLYIEGGYLMLSCALAATRRYNGQGMNNFTLKYRLFDTEKKRCV